MEPAYLPNVARPMVKIGNMIIFTLLCLFFGLVTPFSYFTLIINSAIFGLLAQAPK